MITGTDAESLKDSIEIAGGKRRGTSASRTRG